MSPAGAESAFFFLTSTPCRGSGCEPVAGICHCFFFTWIQVRVPRLYPRILNIEYEFVVALIFTQVIVAISFVCNEISLLRKKLLLRNAELATAIEKFECMAITDELTGVINRRHMMYMLKQQKSVADL